MGLVSIKPTIRYQSGKSGSPDYSRIKFELTTEIKFKWFYLFDLFCDIF